MGFCDRNRRSHRCLHISLENKKSNGKEKLFSAVLKLNIKILGLVLGLLLGLVIFIVLPGILVIGLLLIPLGMIIYRKRLKRTGTVREQKWPYIDLNFNRHRNAFLIFSFGTLSTLVIQNKVLSDLPTFQRR